MRHDILHVTQQEGGIKMKNFRNLLRKRKDSDRGDSNTISFLATMLFLVMLTITLIDVSVYMVNQNIMNNAATNGARLVSVYGGTGRDSTGTPISRRYGAQVSNCVNTANPVVCSVENELKGTTSMGPVKVKSVTCGPQATKRLGEATYCEIQWTYAGIPGSALSFIKPKNQVQVTRLTAESEVIYNGN